MRTKGNDREKFQYRRSEWRRAWSSSKAAFTRKQQTNEQWKEMISKTVPICFLTFFSRKLSISGVDLIDRSIDRAIRFDPREMDESPLRYRLRLEINFRAEKLN